MDRTQARIIDDALTFPMGKIVRRYASDQKLPETVASEHERELKRFLALCAINPAMPYGMGGPVDELWHTFIFFTQDYADFCDKVAGRFLHHEPADSDAIDPKKDRVRYDQFVKDYEAAFGEAPPRHVWPAPPPTDKGAAGMNCYPKCACKTKG